MRRQSDRECKVMIEPIVSVVIPVYNGEKYIKNCLEHVLSQTYQSLEVIVIDDGSADRSYQIAGEIGAADGRVRLLHQENAGVSSARNAALRVMTGEYVVFVDVDDDIEQDYVECLITQMKKPDIELAICGYLMAVRGDEEHGRRCTFTDEIISTELALERILRFQKYNPSIWNKMFEAAIIREHEILFEPLIAIGEDMLFLIRYCMYVNKCAVVGNPKYIYYTNPAGAMLERKSSDKFKEKWLSEWEAVLLVEKELVSHGFPVDAMKIKKVRAADKLLSCIAEYRYPAGEVKKEMLKCLRRSLPWSMREPDYSGQKKLSILLNCISPAFANQVKRVIKKLVKKG